MNPLLTFFAGVDWRGFFPLVAASIVGSGLTAALAVYLSSRERKARTADEHRQLQRQRGEAATVLLAALQNYMNPTDLPGV